MKSIKIIITILAIVMLMAIGACANAAEIVASGKCGKYSADVTWTLDSEGVLTISGSGAMSDYSYSDQSRWNESYNTIKSVVISEGVTTVGDYAFNGCTALTSVSLPNSLTAIGAYAFQNCDALTSISIPDGVTSLPTGAFYSCNSLANVKLPANLTRIGISSLIFTSIEEIDIPDTLTTIGDTAFTGSKLKSFTIPDSVTSIGYNIFSSCGNLTDVYFLGDDLPATLSDIAFNNCSATIHCKKGSAIEGWLTAKNLPIKHIVTIVASGSCGAEGDNVTWTLDSEGLLTISGTGAMDDFSTNSNAWGGKGDSVKSVVIEEGITYIGEYTFYKCGNIESLTLPASLETVAYNAIYSSWCQHLTSIHISDLESWLTLSMDSSNMLMGNGRTLYLNGNPVTDVVVPNGVKSIRAEAFLGCQTLTSISIPDSVESIGSYAFSMCSNLTEIQLPEGLTSISNGTFNKCTGLTKANIPDSVTIINNYAFSECTALTDLYFYGNDMPEIGEYMVFYNCNPTIHCTRGSAIDTWAKDNNFKREYFIVLPDTSLTLPASLKTIESEAFIGTNVEMVVIPDGCTTIGSKAFAGCTDLTLVYIPDSVASIATDAFSGSSNVMFVCESENYAAGFADNNDIYWTIE